MASNRKKQDEKHLKILRNLVSLPGNKQCFDCLQRGPTYVNTTIGSFVCTSCSGLLRGLTPPHRVKSISMATFTPEEIESLKQKGNEYCRKVWLGTYNSNHIQDTKDEHHIKELMVSKYERKKFYVDPSTNASFSVNGTNGASSPHSASPPWTSTGGGAYTPPTAPRANHFVPLSSSPRPQPQTQPLQLPAAMFSTGKTAPDPFGTVSPAAVSRQSPQPQHPPQQQLSFANFENNPVFIAVPAPVPAMTSSASFPSALKPQGEDKYAALKDLDCFMKMQHESQVQQPQPAPPPPPPQQQQQRFDWASATGNNGWQDSNPFQTDHHSTPGCNPFRTGLVLGAEQERASPWGGMGPVPTLPIMTNSQSMPLGNTWAGNGNVRVGSGNSSNPFL